MASVSVSGELGRFIAVHIHSVLQLDVLLLLRGSAREWTPAEVAEELRITDQSAELRLKDLELRGLLASGSSPDSYRYEPLAPAISRLVDELAERYADARHTVIGLIFSQPGDSARTLAEAFRIRKRRDE